MSRYQRQSKGSVLYILCFLLFSGLLLFSAWKLLTIRQEYASGEQKYDALASHYVTSASSQPVQDASSDRSSGEPEAPMDETILPEFAPIRVDFDALCEDAPDIIGWLYCADTPINYPLVAYSDNDYYLHRLPDGSTNSGGTLFMDYLNSRDFSDWNSIIYGHHMKDQSMFGTLVRYREQAYADAHPILYLLTPEGDYKLCVIGGYTTQSASASYAIPADEAGRDSLVDRAVRNTEFQPQYQAQPGQKLITLSTCAYEFEEARFILIAALVPISRLSY